MNNVGLLNFGAVNSSFSYGRGALYMLFLVWTQMHAHNYEKSSGFNLLLRAETHTSPSFISWVLRTRIAAV